MKTYINAFVGTSFLMTMVGAILILGTYFVLTLFHASHGAEITGECIALGVTLIAFLFVFPRVVQTERELEQDISTDQI